MHRQSTHANANGSSHVPGCRRQHCQGPRATLGPGTGCGGCGRRFHSGRTLSVWLQVMHGPGAPMAGWRVPPCRLSNLRDDRLCSSPPSCSLLQGERQRCGESNIRPDSPMTTLQGHHEPAVQEGIHPNNRQFQVPRGREAQLACCAVPGFDLVQTLASTPHVAPDGRINSDRPPSGRRETPVPPRMACGIRHQNGGE